MCLAVFVASDAPLPEEPWSAETPAFAVAPLAERQEPVRQQLARRHVAALWAHTGCGCGFSARLEWDAAARRRSVAALAAYMGAAARQGPVELAVYWDDADEYAGAPDRRLRLAAAELTERDDWLAERSRVEVVPQPRSPRPDEESP
jgi:hypothetical protein